MHELSGGSQRARSGSEEKQFALVRTCEKAKTGLAQCKQDCKDDGDVRGHLPTNTTQDCFCFRWLSVRQFSLCLRATVAADALLACAASKTRAAGA
jgi:hypothetical protein